MKWITEKAETKRKQSNEEWDGLDRKQSQEFGGVETNSEMGGGGQGKHKAVFFVCVTMARWVE